MSRFNLHVSNWLFGFLVLFLAALACTAPGAQQPDTNATVQAVYATITQQAGSPPPVLTATALPATAAPLPATATQFAPPSLSPTPPDSRGNLIAIHKCPAAIIVDGGSSDWPDAAAITRFNIDKVTFDPNKEWTGAGDLSGSVRLCWTEGSLFLFANVTDDVHFQTQRGEKSYLGDEVELMFDTDLRGDFFDTTWDADDHQLSFNPGDFLSLPPAPYRYHPTGGQPRGVRIAAQPAVGGANYVVEAEIVWEELGGQPKNGLNYGLCVAFNDADHPDKPPAEDTLASHCAGLYVFNPTTWQSVTFVP